MLLTLQIENIAIIEHLELTLEPGFTVISGETGAGKSILIEAVNALVGGRTSRELIRTGSDRAMVQGLFQGPEDLAALLAAQGIEPSEDGQVLLQRVFQESGRNVCRVNGTLVTAGVLRLVGERLMDIHGQHDSQSLFRPETHLPLLDAYAGETMREALAAYSREYEAWLALKEKWRQVTGSARERERRLDMLAYQLDELDKANLQPGEDVALEQRSRLFSHAESIVAAFSEAYERLSGEASEMAGARDQLRRAAVAVERVAGVSPAFAGVSEILTDLVERLDEVGRDILDIRDSQEFDPRERDRVEERLAFLQGILRKYGDTCDRCIQYREEIREELAQLRDAKTLQEDFGERLAAQETRLLKQALVLRKLRVAAGKTLSGGMAEQLEELEMPKAAFSVQMAPRPDHVFDASGCDEVEFLFTANPGEPLKPLSRIASGGEMSRVMLAIKTLLADVDRVQTLVFDEIDAGVGGKAAQKVGEKLASMAQTRQILCVTHHAQIASLAAHHHQIGKEEANGRTRTRVVRLEGTDREEEVTRLLSGEHRTETAQGLARELLARGADHRKAAHAKAGHRKDKA